jgi:hypothetical protein
MILVVHQARTLEDEAEVIKITVDVADGDESLWCLVGWFRRVRMG